MPPQTRQTRQSTSEMRNDSSPSSVQMDNQYVTLEAFNAMVNEMRSLQSLIREQNSGEPNVLNKVPDDSDATSSSTYSNSNVHNGILRSVYDNIPQYSGDGDIQTLLDFVDKVDDYLVITDNTSTMEIPLITMKLTGTASVLWRHQIGRAHV